MCPECNGIGRVVRVDPGKFFDRTKSLNEGAILHRDFAVGSWYWHSLRPVRPVRQRQALARLHRRGRWQLLLHGADEKVAIAGPGRSRR